jgi:hypothetical protein
MAEKLNRRDLLLAGATAGLTATGLMAGAPRALFGQAPAVLAPKA